MMTLDLNLKKKKAVTNLKSSLKAKPTTSSEVEGQPDRMQPEFPFQRHADVSFEGNRL